TFDQEVSRGKRILQPNGSTALHAASFYGHKEIVNLLLERGAARNIVNKFNLTPFDEAQTKTIKNLFCRSEVATKQRFVTTTSHLDWVVSHQNTDHVGDLHFWRTHQGCGNGSMADNLKEVGTNMEVNNPVEREQIVWWFRKAYEKNDVTYLIRAYTAETEFYKRLNTGLVSFPMSLKHDPWGGPPIDGCSVDQQLPNNWQMTFTRLVASDDKLKKYRYTGRTFRGLHLGNNELIHYKVGHEIIHKAFVSTSKIRAVAECFSSKLEANKVAALCTYTIRDPLAALDISSLSEFPNEEEVLILPFITFKVQKFEQGHPLEIELDQVGIADL
ncbi:unnamed protein product, partial [Rotaria magnacalcarata]